MENKDHDLKTQDNRNVHLDMKQYLTGKHINRHL